LSKKKLAETLRKLEEQENPVEGNPYRTWGAYEHIARMGCPSQANALKDELLAEDASLGVYGDPMYYWMSVEESYDY
jgi:hypothetical protein